MHNVARPDLRKLTQRLAVHSARVDQVVEGLTLRTDPKPVATEENDWREVRRLGEYLRHSGAVHGHSALAAQAQELCRNSESPENRPAALQNLVRLIGMCGQIEAQSGASAS